MTFISFCQQLPGKRSQLIQYEISPAKKAVPDYTLTFLHDISCTTERATGRANASAALGRFTISGRRTYHAANNSTRGGTSQDFSPRLNVIGKYLTFLQIFFIDLWIYPLGINNRAITGNFIYLSAGHQQAGKT